MLKAVTFTKDDGDPIAIDAYDIVSVEMVGDSLLIGFVPFDSLLVVSVDHTFDCVLEIIQRATAEDGEEWKFSTGH